MTTQSTGRGARSQDPEAVANRLRLEGWAQAYSNRVVDSVLHYRDARGLSNADLLARLGELGWDLTPNTLAGIFQKKRKAMPVTDVMLFALALNVPPVALLFATHGSDDLDLAPDGTTVLKPYEAAKWFSGALPAAAREFADEHQDLADDYYDVADVVALTDEIARDIAAFGGSHAQLVLAIRDGADSTARRLEEAEARLKELANLRDHFRLHYPQASMPALPAALEFIDEPRRNWKALPIEGLTTDDDVEEARKSLPGYRMLRGEEAPNGKA
ncbi:hypothetical protein [Curtobacterium sp. 179-B 9B NHS]|uniref:hypothetical protein n=1 Tax=Curtobacterium sp. 179-B 9B NHS TaxID=3374293 RepID=UPI00387A0DBF